MVTQDYLSSGYTLGFLPYAWLPKSQPGDWSLEPCGSKTNCSPGECFPDTLADNSLQLQLGIVYAWIGDTQDIKGLVPCFPDPGSDLSPDNACKGCPLPPEIVNPMVHKH